MLNYKRFFLYGTTSLSFLLAGCNTLSSSIYNEEKPKIPTQIERYESPPYFERKYDREQLVPSRVKFIGRLDKVERC